MDSANNTLASTQNQHEFKTESAGDYVFVIDKGNPMGDKRGRVLEHRFIMSQVVGRHLSSNEVVHHINGDKKDNRAENLSLLDIKRHHELHQPPDLLRLKCPQCGKIFERVARNARGKRTFCSRSCAGRFYYSTGKFQPRKKQG